MAELIKEKDRTMAIQIFHGTSAKNAKLIEKKGLKKKTKKNWSVESKDGFVYLSYAYAPFYAMNATKQGYKMALIKVEVEVENLYPDDDYLMRCFDKKVYTQEQLDIVNLEDFKYLSLKSLELMGNAAARPEDIKILGVTYFNGKNLILKSDPTITPLNYLIMGNYYKDLSEWIFQGNDLMKFRNAF